MSLTLKPRKAVDEEEIENWDDDDLDIAGHEFASFRSTSMATSATPSHHRDSISSRLSIRSDFDSNHGDEEKQVHLPGDDLRAMNDAIAQAARAGIPISESVPPSALVGGTIKRLGGKKISKIIKSDDWDEDLELPATGSGLQIRNLEESQFPDALRNTSGPSLSGNLGLEPAPVFDLNKTVKVKSGRANLNLDRFRDDEDDDGFFGDHSDTIKVTKNRTPRPITNILPPTPQKQSTGMEDDFEADFDIPASEPLRLSTHRDTPKTPINAAEDFDDWAEGSLGTRHGGTRRDGRSARSSSASALSPSVSSSITMESEDDGLDGLVLPLGPLKFDELLKKRQESDSPEHTTATTSSKSKAIESTSAQDHDFMTGLEFDGDVFDSNKLTLNRNVKIKNTRQASPQRPKTAVSLVFTNKPSPPVNSRIPRPLGGGSSLAPVSESGGPILTASRRSQSRLTGHSSHASLSNISTPPTPSHAMPPSTPRRRDLTQKSSLSGLRNEPTTTNAQLLKIKRSMPAMRSAPSPAKPMGSRFDRPSSRTDNSRPMSLSRPKTPVDKDRSGAGSSMSHARKNPVPFLPAGTSQAQSHHISIKTSTSGHFRRNDSESSNSTDFRPMSRAISRSTMRSPSPSRSRTRGAEALAREAAAKRQIKQPVRRRHFGDGGELDGFDDLPTSQQVESRYTKKPIGQGAPKVLLRNKLYQNIPDRTASPAPLTPFSPAKQENLPRFARDTNASRMAREQVLSQRAPSGAPMATITNQWKAQVTARTGLSTISQAKVRSKKHVPTKPQLIKPLGDTSKTSKSIKGMVYNPLTFRWEGNENDLSPFDMPSDSPTSTMPSHTYREKENSTPRPALITNINASQGVQVVGGMVFDPVKMCWLKMPSQKRDSSRPRTGGSSASAGTMDAFDALDEEDEDVFKDVPDLEDKPNTSKASDIMGGGSGMDSGLKDEWLVGEEFDVGPEFIRRQREEEERWRRKCEKWLGPNRDAVENDDWRWCIRDVVSGL